MENEIMKTLISAGNWNYKVEYKSDGPYPSGIGELCPSVGGASAN
jgi:hypothetical protein